MLITLLLSLALAQPAGDDGAVVNAAAPDEDCIVQIDGALVAAPCPEPDPAPEPSAANSGSETLGEDPSDSDVDGDATTAATGEEGFLWRMWTALYLSVSDLVIWLLSFVVIEGHAKPAALLVISWLGDAFAVMLAILGGTSLLNKYPSAQRAVDRLLALSSHRLPEPESKRTQKLQADLHEARKLQGKTDELCNHLKSTNAQLIRIGIGQAKFLKALTGDAHDLTGYTVEAVERRLALEKKTSSSPTAGARHA